MALSKEDKDTIAEIVAEGMTAAMPAAVQAAALAIQKAEKQRLAAEAKAIEDVRLARIEDEKNRPPRRKDISPEELLAEARKYRPGSSVQVKIHRRFRGLAWRKSDDRSEPPRMGGLQPDEVVTMPVSHESMFDGQSPREMAHMRLRGMFEHAKAA